MKRTLFRSLLHCSLFLVGLFGTAMCIRGLESMPFWSWFRDKPSFYRANAERYDTVILGSSLMHFGVLPELLDAKAKELGHTQRTFNLAMSGLRSHDIDVLFDWVLSERPPNLKRLLVELSHWDQGGRDGTWMTDQVIQAHPIHKLWSRVRSAATGRGSWRERLTIVGSVVAHTAVNTLRIGRGVPVVEDLLARWRGTGGETRRSYPMEGYAAVEAVADAGHRKLHESWLANPDWYENRARWMLSGESDRMQTGPLDLVSIRAQIARARAAGVELIYVIAPALSFDFIGRNMVEAIEDEVRVVALDTAAVAEPLLRRELWYDHAHLVRAGAEVLTGLLATRLAAR